MLLDADEVPLQTNDSIQQAMTSFFTEKFADSKNPPELQTERFDKIKARVAEEVAAGRTLTILWSYFLESWRSLANGKTSIDGVVAEMLRDLNYASLVIVYDAFNRRLNLTELPEEEDPEEWSELFLTCLPKTTTAMRLKEWRAIGIGPAIIKWFDGCTILLMDDLTTYATNTLGGLPGHQLMDITEWLRLLLQKCDDLGLPAVFAKSDVSTAYDEI